MPLYLMLVGCFCLAGNTLLMYKSPTLIFSYLGFSSGPTQHSRTSRSTSGSIVRKNGSEYLSCPVRLRTRWTVAGNLPLDCRSRYCPTLQTKVPGLGGASTQMPSWLRTSSAGTVSCSTRVNPVLFKSSASFVCGHAQKSAAYKKNQREHPGQCWASPYPRELAGNTGLSSR